MIIIMACDSPITIKLNPPRLAQDGKSLIYNFPADCGKCLKCLIKRKSQWSYRMFEEKSRSLSSYFITLTYADENLTFGDYGATSNKNDHFEFIKNLKENEKEKNLLLRASISREEMERLRNKSFEFSKGFDKKQYPLKYYGISEYGDRFGRPHWHYILFNLRDTNNVAMSWPYGISQVDECNQNTIDYVLKYMVKDHSGEDYEHREKEKSYMSKGMGLKDHDKNFIKHIKKPEGNQIINSRGQKIGVPRYYRKKYLTEKEDNKKLAYISTKIKEDEKKFEDDCLRVGANPDLLKLHGKENRQHLLKDRTPRKLEK